ncbi:MAG: sensor histidine kinase [Spirochaetaceae bacterium]|nr:sensor histidine kinase [Spirochaetaceae bacterium]
MERIQDAKLKILDQLLRFLAVAGGIAYLPSLYASVVTGLWYLALIDTLGYGAILAGALSRRFGFRTKLAVLVGSNFAIAAAVLAATGPYGAGYIWLICSVFCAALLGSRGYVIAALLLAAAVYTAYAALVLARILPFDQAWVSFLALGSNLALICLLLATAARRILASLEGLALERKALADRLAAELETERRIDAALREEIEAKESLLKELHHRVSNNLQVVLSLISIESAAPVPGPEAVARLARRVRALSFANSALLSSPEAATLDLHPLVTSVAERTANDSGIPFRVHGFSRRIRSEDTTGFTILFYELIAELATAGRPVDIELRPGNEGEPDRLAFSWKPGDEPAAAAAIAARLAGDPVLAGLAAPFAPRREAGGGNPAIVIDLPRRRP